MQGTFRLILFYVSDALARDFIARNKLEISRRRAIASAV